MKITSCLLTYNSNRSVISGLDSCDFAIVLITFGWLITKVGLMQLGTTKWSMSLSSRRAVLKGGSLLNLTPNFSHAEYR